MAGMDSMGTKGKRTQRQVQNDKFTHFSRRRQSADFPFRAFSDPLFACAVQQLAAEGAAVMLGAAQGGAGIVLSIFLDGNKDKRFIGDVEQFSDWCHDVIESFGSTSEDAYEVWGLPHREV